jgi:HEAT repeat protein
MPVTTSLDHLITALRGKSESARRAAVEALVAQGSAAVKPLRDALADPHWEVRRAAVQALGRMGDPQATIAVFRMWEIGSHIIHLQQATVEAWERLKGTVAVEPLCGLLTDKDAAVRRAAVEGLGNIGRREALPALKARLHWLRGETDQNVLAALRAAIEKIEEATKHLKGKPRAGEVETPTPAGRPRAAGDAPTAEGRPRTTSDQ